MRRIFVVGLISFLCCSAFAEPEIRGTAVELTHFLNGISKTTSVAGEAEVRVPAHRAILSLGIVTENKSLQDALRQNAEMRNKVADFLRKQGIPSDRIQASKFSSTPKFGLFGDKAKSYRVENVMRVAVQDEKEFQAAAGAVDSWQEVRFGGVEFEYADKEALRQKAISDACDM
ncbi:MAG TPA: SIMPL domain-containing protein, partial [Verrucomicrobiae bacterium]|nr:SIMPL domain-containing protein [Verrucomicrobiae bacterium]